MGAKAGPCTGARMTTYVLIAAMAGTILWFIGSMGSPAAVPPALRQPVQAASLESVELQLTSLSAALQAVADRQVAVQGLGDIGASRQDIAVVLQEIRAFLHPTPGAPAAAAPQAPVGLPAAPAPADQAGCLASLGLAGVDMDPIPQGGGSIIASHPYVNVDIGGWRAVGIPADENFRVVQHDDTSPERDWYVFWARATYGQWEPQTLAIMRELMTSATTYIDFGTWIGPTILYASRKAGQVWGLEADPAAYGEAARNLAANAGKVGNVHLRRACISDATAPSVPFHSYKRPGDSMAGLLWDKNKEPEVGGVTWHVDCFTLPDFVARHSIPLAGREVVIKVDTEGGEALIMQTPGLLEWLRHNRVTLFLSVHVQHVEGSLKKAGAYPEAGKRAIAAALAAYTHVYDDTHFRDGALSGGEAEFYDKLCASCTYIMRWEPLTPTFVEAMAQRERDDEADQQRRQAEWDKAHPNG